MNKMEIINELEKVVNEGNYGFTIKHQPMNRNNESGIGILIVADKYNGCYPMVSFDNLYKGSIDEMVEDLVQLYENTEPANHEDVSKLFDKDYILNNVRPAVIQTEGNESYLEGKISIPFLDMSIIFVLVLDKGKTVLSKDWATSCSVSEEELYAAAKRNISGKASFKNMNEKVAEIYGITVDELIESGLVPETTMTIVVASPEDMASDRGTGAGVLILTDPFNQLLEEFNTNKLYILPSSIHEVIAMDANEVADDDALQGIRNTIGEANTNCVDNQDRLTYSLYEYTKENGLQIVE